MRNENDHLDDMLTNAIMAKDIDKVREAFKNGAKPNDGIIRLPRWDSNHSNFYLMLKVFPEALPVFLENGLNLERETFCANALMDAIDSENTDAIKKLFEAGAEDECFFNDDDPEWSSCSSVYYAVYMQRAKSLHFLLESGYIWRNNEEVLSKAIELNDERIVRDLVDHGCELDPDRERMSFMTDLMDESLAERIHDCLSIAKKTRKKPWALFFEYKVSDELIEAIANNMHITLLTLLDDGAPIDGEWGAVLLWHAVSNNNVFAIKELVERGVDINGRAYGGQTPIFNICNNCSLYTAKLLVKLGADINAKNCSGVSLLAMLEGDIRRAERDSRPEEDIERLKDIRQYLIDNGAICVNEIKDRLDKRIEELKKKNNKTTTMKQKDREELLPFSTQG